MTVYLMRARNMRANIVDSHLVYQMWTFWAIQTYEPVSIKWKYREKKQLFVPSFLTYSPRPNMDLENHACQRSPARVEGFEIQLIF